MDSTPADPGGTRDEVGGVDLASLLLALRLRWRVLVAGLAVGALLGLLVAAVLGPRHVATLPVRATASAAAGELPVVDVAALAAELDRLTFELESDELEAQVAEGLGQEVEVTTTVPEESTLVMVQAEASSPVAAMSAVEAAVTLVVERRRSAAVAGAQELADRLRLRADELASSGRALSDQFAPPRAGVGQTLREARRQRRVNILLDQQAAYEQRASDIEIAGATTPIGLEVVDPGSATVGVAAPTRTDLVLLVGLLGLLGALAALWIIEHRRGPLVTPRHLAARVAAPVVDGRSESELEVLALSLVDRMEATPPAVGLLQVGATTVDAVAAIPFAEAMAALDQRVTIIDGDLRHGRPGFGPGLASYLAGTASAADLTRGRPAWPRLVPAQGPGRSSPLQLARATSLGPLVAALAPDPGRDVVMLVVPDPMLRPEAGRLLGDTAGVVLEVSIGQVRQPHLDRLLVHLSRSDQSVLGVVLTWPGSERGHSGAVVAGNEARTGAAPVVGAGPTRDAGPGPGPVGNGRLDQAPAQPLADPQPPDTGPDVARSTRPVG